ncbi:calponin homology domain-containing protein DDB_G0272472-like isoform X2 [Teleopsis dalmanni]|uniref:calponin homology domain-containing protein DDB_G0272472-like isoform X2 n=1 Tax=Teleopsis dalmanni TaxID=139649 RepID=UPI0018CF8A8D|nr:calponin homology domain-containing protein DDB_G0272472-like isoform X2 [Teleopsis dalmanni]
MAERRGTKALELWCRRMTDGYPGVKIDNMTTSWRDGLAFCAMIHHFRPDLIEFDKLNKTDVYYNNELAFTTAEKYLGIPALLDADDMAAYEVPDRLSILTYLSQFYQVFAAQDASNRLKRPSPSVEKSQITKTPGPPPKMAHVGVPRRDPCQKCQLPVFLAERLTVGKRTYHRTCLKCARCGSQLSPGSFYETEVDDEYCCETCPDEEVLAADVSTSSVQLRTPLSDHTADNLASTSTAVASGPQSRNVRSSIADRLAFFEKTKPVEDSKTIQNHKLLQKSVSDEEKSKSLKHMEANAAQYKMNSAFNTFLNDTIDGENEPEANSEPISVTEDSKTDTQMDTSDTETDNETHAELSLDNAPPPALPKSQPPAEVTVSATTTPIANKRFTATAQLQLSSTTAQHEKTTKTSNEHDSPERRKSELQLNLNTTTTPVAVPRITTSSSDNSNNNHSYTPILDKDPTTTNETTTATATTTAIASNLTQKSNEINLVLSETNDNDCVTKDIAADTLKTAAQTQSADNNTEKSAVDVEMKNESAESIDADTVMPDTVELREKPVKSIEQHQLQPEDAATTERLSVVRARLQQFEVISNNENNNNNHIDINNENVTLENNKTIAIPTNSNAEENAHELITKESDDKSTLHVHVQQMETEVATETKKPEIKPSQSAVEETIVQPETETPSSLNEVPLYMKTKDNENENENENVEFKQKEIESNKKVMDTNQTVEVSTKTADTRRASEDYPEDLNPFKSDDEDEDEETVNKENLGHSVNSNASFSKTSKQKAQNSNPFDSSDDEIELEKSHSSTAASTPSSAKVPPPRPPPPRISRNPFGDDTDDDQNFSRRSSLSSSLTKRTPVPTPRSHVDYYGSVNSLGTSTPQSLQRNSDVRGSNNSLTSSSGGTVRGRKSRKAPAPPPPTVKELFASNASPNGSITSTPSSSTVGTPKSSKKRLAPAPPKPARMDPTLLPQITLELSTESKNLHSYPLQSELDSALSDEEKALLEGKQLSRIDNKEEDDTSRRSSRRLIPLDASLLNDEYVDEENVSKSDDVKHEQQHLHNEEESNVVYRRVIIPPNIDTPTHDKNPLLDDLNGEVTHDRQLEKLKDNKEAKNRNRQSQISASSGAEDGETLHYNKSVHGKWKRRKGPAPALPIPPKKVLQMLPLQEIRHELEIIEVQQQGLEKQGVILEKMIRDRCEGQNGEPIGKPTEDVSDGKTTTATDCVQNSKEVEDLILQLFELVNEKNELFRRQAELMYLRRQHRLEQEQADLEYEIRVLMAQPECNKTDTDKAREEALIARLVEVVQLRNEVIECLEMDRLREAEEDLSIKQQLELHSAKREDDEESRRTLTKLSKKERKKQKEAKKLGKSKKIDADKDADESELNAAEKQKLKKKKRNFFSKLT